jgi:hypothetical protein
MKWLALSVAALVALFVALEWGAAPPSDLTLGSGERPTRHVHTGSRSWRPPGRSLGNERVDVHPPQRLLHNLHR